jgi:hypothetical protein
MTRLRYAAEGIKALLKKLPHRIGIPRQVVPSST